MVTGSPSAEEGQCAQLQGFSSVCTGLWKVQVTFDNVENERV